MTCRVVSLPERGSEPLVDFYVRPSAKIDRSTDRDWEGLLRGLVERFHEASDGILKPELFLFFLGDQLRHGPEPGFLADLLDAAHGSCLGSPIYLVTPASLLPSRTAYLPWLEIAIERGAADLLQVQYPSTEPEAITSLWRPTAAGLSLLEEACDRADARLQLLRKHQLRGRWHCYTRPGEWPRYARLLLGSRQPAHGRESGEVVPDYLLVVPSQSEPPEEPMWLVEDACEEFPNSRMLVATLPPVEASPDLGKHCRDKTAWHHPLSFSGYLELWFFYRRLRMPSTVWPPLQLEASAVDVNDGPRLAIQRANSASTVLFTCAWGMDSEAAFQGSARALAVLVSALPLTTRYHVIHATDPGRLSRYLELQDAGSSFVWVHLGPGQAEGAVADFSGQPQVAEGWLSPFLEHELSVPLALFLCDRSTAIARCFAEAGAGVTVGFAEAPLAHGSRRLATDTLHSAVRHGVRREAILSALNSGHLDPAGEVSASRPSVFISRLP